VTGLERTDFGSAVDWATADSALSMIHLKCMEEEMAYLQNCSGCETLRLVGFRTELSDRQALRMGSGPNCICSVGRAV